MDYSFLEETERTFNSKVDFLKLPTFIKSLPRELLGRPYHNSHHLHLVALNTLKISQSEGLDERLQKVLFTAAICHDLDYVSKDNEPANIILAVSKFKRVSEFLNFTKDEVSFGTDSIRNTDTSITQEFCGDTDRWILHDADLTIWCQIKSFDHAWYLCEGIEKELGFKTDIHSTLSFLKNSKIFTMTGKTLINEFESTLISYPTVGRWISYS